MITSLKRTIKYGLKSLFRDGEIAIANIFIVTVTIFLISSLFLFHQFNLFFLSYLKEKADFSVYFKEGVPEEEILKIQDEILKMGNFKVNYISKETALKEFQKRHQKNPTLMEALKEIGANPFLASLEIKAKEIGQYEAISNFLENEKKDLIEKIDYFERKPLVEKIFSLSSKIEKGGIIFSLTLAFISILVTFITVKLSILNFGEEISIQRLVGASNWFIRGPFLVQGIIYGILAALISTLIFSSILLFLNLKLSNFLGEFDIFQIFSKKFLTFLFINFSAGIFLGTIPTFFAIRKYLKI